MKMKKAFAIFTIIVLLCAAYSPGAVAASEVLKKGVVSDDVKLVQQRLKQWDYYDGAVDGIFGSGTEAAVKRFQKAHNLTPDGIIGPATGKAIGITISSSSKSSSVSSGDTYLLAKLVYSEARGEPYTGQVAVAAVVLNRVDSSQFPNTISGVIYQRHAFTAVDDGQIDLEPDDQALRAAKDAINGWDPSGGALYYYNPQVATSEWIYSRTVITEIGRHRFAI